MTITASEYAQRIGYSPAAVTKRLKKQSDENQPYCLPGAVSVKKYGNSWMIELAAPFRANVAAKQFKQDGKNLVNSI